MSHEDILKKHNLPSLEELEKELGVIDEDEQDLVQDIISKLLSKSRKYSSFIEEMLHPDSNIVSMQEASMFSNEEREKLFDIFREITLFQRTWLLLELSSSEEKKVQYFKDFYAYFNSIKPQLEKFVTQAISIWKLKEVTKANVLGYFG